MLDTESFFYSEKKELDWEAVVGREPMPNEPLYLLKKKKKKMIAQPKIVFSRAIHDQQRAIQISQQPKVALCIKSAFSIRRLHCISSRSCLVCLRSEPKREAWHPFPPPPSIGS